MTTAELRRQALLLSSEERIELALDLWNSVSESAPVPRWYREVLRERTEELETMAPGERSAPWEEVRRRIWPKA